MKRNSFSVITLISHLRSFTSPLLIEQRQSRGTPAAFFPLAMLPWYSEQAAPEGRAWVSFSLQSSNTRSSKCHVGWHRQQRGEGTIMSLPSLSTYHKSSISPAKFLLLSLSSQKETRAAVVYSSPACCQNSKVGTHGEWLHWPAVAAYPLSGVGSRGHLSVLRH